MIFRLIFENGLVVDAKSTSGNYGIGYANIKDWIYDLIDHNQ